MAGPIGRHVYQGRISIGGMTHASSSVIAILKGSKNPGSSTEEVNFELPLLFEAQCVIPYLFSAIIVELYFSGETHSWNLNVSFTSFLNSLHIARTSDKLPFPNLTYPREHSSTVL